MKNMLHKWLVIIFITYISRSKVKSDENEVKLQKYLFANPDYHYMARPVKQTNTKIWANFSLSISQIVSIDMRNEAVTTSIWPTQEWYDEYMQWNPEDFGGITNTGVSPDRIWKPEIVLYNNVDGRFEVEFQSRVQIGYRGNCLWAPPTIFKTHCKINAQHFPYDEQFCPLTFLSFDYDYTQVEIVSKFSEGDYTGDQYWHSSEWSIMSARTETYLTSCASCLTNNHSAVTVMLHLKRKPLFYSVNLVLPILMVSILTVMSFYLPSECCEKITLTVTVLLSVTMLLLIVSKMVPKTSYHVPLLNMYLIFILLLVSFSLIGKTLFHIQISDF
ncbi:neuronal acetylcholine receptor subunit alpha-2-like [Symsagittifera roscoffensis]|uniref:neuronal acetylcholine receptor subunit alpha-2-like n=1 Tax=Symsagittifera roscoffensis TaxID=84072 RepID=UPI00307BA727